MTQSFTTRAGLAAALLTLAIAAPALEARARTLRVGPTQPMKMPSEAAAAVHDGDVVMIDPGEYFDCAVWKASNVTIQGTGPGVVITDKTCAGKGIFVTDGNDITVRELTLQRARVPDANGAGIRAEGHNLTVENVRFLNNENGILANADPDGTIRILGSTFEKNGKCEPSCAHGIYINDQKLLHVENSRFFNTRVAHHIKSRAQTTELIGDTIEDGPEGTASYLVDISNGGTLVVENSKLQKGPNASNHSAAIVIGAEGITHPTRAIRVHGNSFVNDMVYDTVFVRNLTATEAELSGNKLRGKVVPLAGDGAVK